MVKLDGQLSKAFSVNTGLKQGDNFLSLFFNIASKKVFKKVLNTCIGVKLQDTKVIKQIAYANDIVLVYYCPNLRANY